jgi:predicted alpha/beta-fold hydrolase
MPQQLTVCAVETIFAAKMRQAPHVDYVRECLLMPDRGCVACDWDLASADLPENAPVLILMPGDWVYTY